MKRVTKKDLKETKKELKETKKERQDPSRDIELLTKEEMSFIELCHTHTTHRQIIDAVIMDIGHVLHYKGVCFKAGIIALVMLAIEACKADDIPISCLKTLIDEINAIR